MQEKARPEEMTPAEVTASRADVAKWVAELNRLSADLPSPFGYSMQRFEVLPTRGK